MVRKYIRKSQRKTWSADSMRLAIESVIKHGFSIRKASIENEVPHATLSRKIHQCRSDPEKELELITNPKGSNFQTVFNREQENILCQYINTLENQLVGITGTDVRRLAFQVAEKFKLPHRFNKDVGTAGEDWYRGFLKRNPEVLIKKPDSLTEKSREFSKEKVYKFFDLLENIIDDNHLEASDIYSLDETVITCLLKSNMKSENVESKSSASEQNKLVTAIMCFSASGVYVPLMLISPCEYKMSYCNGTPPQAWAEFDASGQIQLDTFVKWLQKFIEFSKASRDSPVLLIIDGYRSYLKNLQVLEVAKENGVHIICLPPHCTDKLHPLHYSFMKTLSTTYTNEITNWSYLHGYSNSGQSVSVNEVFQLFGSAFLKASTMVSPVNSFRNTGIWPTDRDIFEENFVQISSKEETSNTSENNTSKLFKSAVEEACQEIIMSDVPTNRLSSAIPAGIVNEPIVVITKGSSQPYVMQSMETINHQNGQQFIQQQYQVIKQDCMQNVQFQSGTIENETIIKNYQDDHNGEISSVVIPPEAQLSEVRVEDLQSLVQSQRKLYFYVSPYRLNLSS